jgi:tetratricopeptide (TPR) repeat protein
LQRTESEIVSRSTPSVLARGAPSRAKSAALAPAEVTTDWRFHVAALVRVSDNIVSRAVEAYDRMFGLDERDESEIHFEFGKRLADEDRLDDAVCALRKVVRARPDDVQALYELARIQLRRGASHAAIDALQKAKAAGSSDTKVHLLLADALCREEKLEEALKETEAALALDPDAADTHYRRALLLDRLERHAGAAEALESAIRIAPRVVRYHQSLGFMLESLGRRKEAIRAFKRALECERAREFDLEAALD